MALIEDVGSSFHPPHPDDAHAGTNHLVGEK
jgi:hypothetical protein